MGQDGPTRTIEKVGIDKPYKSDELWLEIHADGDKWSCMWDTSYDDGLIIDLLDYYELDFEQEQIFELVGEELPVRENDRGEWVAVDTDRFQPPE